MRLNRVERQEAIGQRSIVLIDFTIQAKVPHKLKLPNNHHRLAIDCLMEKRGPTVTAIPPRTAPFAAEA